MGFYYSENYFNPFLPPYSFVIWNNRVVAGFHTSDKTYEESGTRVEL